MGRLDVVTRFLADTSGLDKGASDAGKTISGFGHTVDVGGVAKLAAFAGAAGLAVAAIAGMTAAASEDRTEQEKLTTVIQAAGAAHGDYAAEVDKAIAAGQAKAFTDTETRDALASLVTATGDVTAATALLGPAQDIARFAGVDLATAADAVAKAHAGNAKALLALVPGLEKGATATDTLAAAQAAAAGQADTFAASTQGQTQMAADSFKELGETIGTAFLPILDAIIPAIVPIVQQLGILVKSLLPVLIPLIQAVAAALTIVAKVLSTVVGWLVQLVQWLTSAIGKIGDFLSSINPLKGISLPSLPFLSAASAPLPGGLYATAYGSGSGGLAVAPLTVNVYGGDPDAVVAVIGRWAAHNGGSAALLRRIDRG